MTALGPRSASHLDDAAQLEFGRYVNYLSDYASQVELLLKRLARKPVTINDPRLSPLLDAARALVNELRQAESSQVIPERDLAVNQLLPFKVYRSVVATTGEFRQLPALLEDALFKPQAHTKTEQDYGQLADLLDNLNSELQRQADEAVAG